MKRVLVTGISGSGKSTVIRELAARGHKAIDTDYDGWSRLVDVPGSAASAFYPGKDWNWDEDRMARLLSAEDPQVLFIAGAAPNQPKFYERFDAIVLLSASTEVIAARVGTRTNNPFGKRPEELAAILDQKRTIEPILRRAASVEIDTGAPLNEVIDELLRLVR